MSSEAVRGGLAIGVMVLIAYSFWSLYNESGALSRLSSTAGKYPYSESCDIEANITPGGKPNCVDLNHYVFVYGPIIKALRRDCTGKPPMLLSFEKGKVAKSEIYRVEKLLKFRAENGTNSPCGSDG